jgi:hypothetical protein
MQVDSEEAIEKLVSGEPLSVQLADRFPVGSAEE